MFVDRDLMNACSDRESTDNRRVSTDMQPASTDGVVMCVDKREMCTRGHGMALPTRRPTPAAPRMPMADPNLIRGFASSAT